MTKKDANKGTKKSAKKGVKKAPDARGEAMRQRILLAAIEAFAEKGFEAASTRDIAKRAKTDQGLLTYHFPNKDKLWRAAADKLFEQQVEQLEPIIESAPAKAPREVAREAIRVYVRFVAAHPEIFRFLVDEGNQSNDRMRWLVDTHLKPRFEFMKTYGAIAATGIDDSLAPHAFYALLGAGSLIFAVAPKCRRLSGLDPRKSEAVEAHADYIANLMVP
jgi:TetR/AcrR family transcriptional regulator